MKIKKIFLLSFLALIVSSPLAKAASTDAITPQPKANEYTTVSQANQSTAHNFGLGVMLGEPTGISGKYWLDEQSAIDSGLAWSFAGGQTAFHVHSDYLLHNFSLFKINDHAMQFFYGGGARLKFGDRTKFGIRAPVGLAYKFDPESIDVFFEVAPILDLAPSTEVSINIGIGARYYF